MSDKEFGEAERKFEPYAVYHFYRKTFPQRTETYPILEVALQRARELIAEGAKMVRVYNHSKDEGETLIFEFPDQRLREKMREVKQTHIELSSEEAQQIMGLMDKIDREWNPGYDDKHWFEDEPLFQRLRMFLEEINES